MTTPTLLALRDWLQAQRVTHVALESTGVYWKPIYSVLQLRRMSLSNKTRLGALPAIGALLVSGYCLFFRVHDLEESFWLLGEQVRDWYAVQGSFSSLPLSGPRSVNSGLNIGPAYYWFLWGSRRVLSPVLGPFPHTGGWAISLLHTVGDFFLLLALWRRLHSWPLAAAAVLLFGTSAHDAGLTATIWNPPVAVACVKLATAALLWNEQPTAITAVLSLAFAWLALQMHPSAIVVTLPLTLWVVYTVGSSGNVTRITVCAFVLAISVGLVFIPYVVDSLDGGQGGVAFSLRRALSNPVDFLRPAESATAVMWALDLILAAPLNFGWVGWLVVIGVAAAVVTRGVSSFSVCTAGVVLTTIMVFSLWQGNFGEYYWFLVVGPAAAVCLVTPLALLRPSHRMTAGVAALVFVLLLQPMRARLAWGPSFRQSAYGTLLRGVSEIVKTGQPVRGLNLEFDVPAGMDPLFLLDLAGGRVDVNAPSVAAIKADGSVSLQTQ